MSSKEIKPIWLILPDPQVENMTKKVLSDNPDLVEWCEVCVADSVTAVPVAKHAVSKGAKAIISRGGTASLLRDTLPHFTIVEIEPNIPLIVLRYFDLVRKYGEENVLLLAAKAFLPSDAQLDDLTKHGYNIQIFKESFPDRKLGIDTYCLSLNDLAIVLKNHMKKMQSPIFVFGDASASTVATELGIPNEIIQSNENEILAAIKNALRLITKVFIGQAMVLPEVEIAVEKAIKPVMNEFGFEVLAQVDRYRPETINVNILEKIRMSSLIIIDVSGERPNCYFEIGYGKGLNKPVIITAKDGTKLHFDIAGDRCLFWKSWEELDAKLRHALVEIGYKESSSKE